MLQRKIKGSRDGGRPQASKSSNSASAAGAACTMRILRLTVAAP